VSIVSTDSLNFSIIRETTKGVTPTTPTWQSVALTGESLVFAPTTQDSATLGGTGRFAKPANVTGFEVSGDFNVEWNNQPALDLAIAGVLANDWGICPVIGTGPGGAIDTAARNTVGNTQMTFSVEKRFDNPGYVAGFVPTVTPAAAGSQTADIDITGAAATGTGMIVVDLILSTGESEHITVPISVGDDANALSIALKDAINTAVGTSVATASTGSDTIDAGTGNTITKLDARAGGDQYFYQRFAGVMFDSLTITTSPNSPVTGTITTLGGEPTLDYLPLPGATYTSAGSSAVYTAPEIVDLMVGTMGVNTHCWTDLTLTISSNGRAISCLGSKGSRETVLGSATASLSGNIYFADQQILEALLANQALGDGHVTFKNADGDFLRFDMYGLKPISGQISAGGAGQDMVIPIELQPTPVKVCEDGSGNPWDSGLIVSKVNTAPTLP
jgi:hypothetical protein